MVAVVKWSHDETNPTKQLKYQCLREMLMEGKWWFRSFEEEVLYDFVWGWRLGFFRVEKSDLDVSFCCLWSLCCLWYNCGLPTTEPRSTFEKKDGRGARADWHRLLLPRPLLKNAQHLAKTEGGAEIEQFRKNHHDDLPHQGRSFVVSMRVYRR